MSDLEKTDNSWSADKGSAEVIRDEQLAACTALSTAGQGKSGDTGYILNSTELGVAGQTLRTASDGRTILIPQPSRDPNDPLNWSSLKKHVMLLTIAVVAFMSDFGSSIAVVTLLPQAK